MAEDVKILMLKGEKGDTGVSGDYATIDNKPSINGVELVGDKSLYAFDIASWTDLSNEIALRSEIGNALQVDIDVLEDETSLLGTRLATAENDINVLDARMDTFASLPDGSTSGNAELLDIRVGADGTTYPSAGDAVRDQVSYLKDDLFEYVLGIDKEISISGAVAVRYHAVICKGARYTLTNNTNGAIEWSMRTLDDQVIYIHSNIPVGATVHFTASSDGYRFGIYCAGSSGTFTIKGHQSNIEVYSKLLAQMDFGNIDFGDLVENKYIATTGAEANYNGWSATDFISTDGLFDKLYVTSPASSGGNYNAFYDSSKTFISNFPISAGLNKITIPDNAKYFRLSNNSSTLESTIVYNTVGYLNYKINDIDIADNNTIYKLNPQESMIANAGANYGYHSQGESNVQKRFSMLVTTDPHGDATAMERAVEYLNDMPCFDCGVCLGDLQADTFSDNDGTWYTNAIKDATKDWLTLIGNHDVGLGKNPSSTGNQQQVYDKFIAPNIQYAGVTDIGKSYYYKDLASYKIRLICLNAYDVDDNTIVDGEYVVPRYTEYYSQAQITWLIDLLENTPSDYHVMVLTHNTPKASVKDTSVKFNNKIYSYSPESSQQGIVADILDAWQNGTALSHTYPCSNTHLSDVVVSADFTSRGTGIFICFLTGHMHVDAIGHITSFPNQNVFTFASTNAGTWQNDWSDLPRADGTKAEDCITALSVDTSDRKIYINRIGSSVSRWFTVREPSVISY